MHRSRAGVGSFNKRVRKTHRKNVQETLRGGTRL